MGVRISGTLLHRLITQQIFSYPVCRKNTSFNILIYIPKGLVSGAQPIFFWCHTKDLLGRVFAACMSSLWSAILGTVTR